MAGSGLKLLNIQTDSYSRKLEEGGGGEGGEEEDMTLVNQILSAAHDLC
jgi:hypothetical protein